MDAPLVQAAQNVVPVAVAAGDKVEGYAGGPAIGACRLIGPVGIRGSRSNRVVVECGAW